MSSHWDTPLPPVVAYTRVVRDISFMRNTSKKLPNHLSIDPWDFICRIYAILNTVFIGAIQLVDAVTVRHIYNWTHRKQSDKNNLWIGTFHSNKKHSYTNMQKWKGIKKTIFSHFNVARSDKKNTSQLCTRLANFLHCWLDCLTCVVFRCECDIYKQQGKQNSRIDITSQRNITKKHHLSNLSKSMY